MANEETVKAGNPPVKKYRSGAISASVFNNSAEKDGNTFEYQTIVLQRAYTTDDGKTWTNEIINLRANDIKKVETVLAKAYETVNLSEDDN